MVQRSSNLIGLMRSAARWHASPVAIADTQAACLRIRDFPRRFVFNADLDGVLSAHLLKKHLGWEPVGASACSGLPTDSLWLPSGSLGTDVVFVDLWVATPDYAVIDQHIVAIDLPHARDLRSHPLKVNPNLLWVRTSEASATDAEHHYRWKYPFGVVHFLIAALESIGEPVRIDDEPLHGSATAFDLFLRADDAARSTAGRYRQNALGWWEYLCAIGGGVTAALAERACCMGEPEALRRQADVEHWIRSCAHRHSVLNIGDDAGLSKHLLQAGWSSGADGVVGGIGEACGFTRMATHARWIRRPLRGARSDAGNPDSMRAALSNPDLFSYAVTARFGTKAATGFSCSFRR